MEDQNKQVNQMHITIITRKTMKPKTFINKIKNIMKKIKSIFAIAVFSFVFFGCTKEDWQELQAGANCDVNHTAVVVFENRSTSNTTYDVVWNNTKIATLKPGEKTKAQAFSAGSHTYVFYKAGTNDYSCQPGYPNLAQCSSYTFWCDN